MSILSKLQALLTAANTKTGESDTTLTDAMQTLVDGYGQGGGYSLDDIISGAEPSGVLVSNATTVRRGFSQYQTSITSITMPNVTSVQQDAFSNNTNLTYVFFGGENMDLSNYVFRGCSSLREIHIPRWKSNGSFGGYGLQNCSSLRLIDFGNVNATSFNNMPSCPLDTIILRNNGVATLTANALDNSTAFKQGGTGGTVYVPENQIENYKVATNWSTYYGYGTMNFLAIEGSQYDLS